MRNVKRKRDGEIKERKRKIEIDKRGILKDKKRQLRFSYSCVSDQFDSILLSSLLDWPLPIDLDSVEDPLLVEVVDGGGQVVEAVLVADERAERVGGKVAASERGHHLQRRVLGPEGLEVGLSF